MLSNAIPTDPLPGKLNACNEIVFGSIIKKKAKNYDILDKISLQLEVRSLPGRHLSQFVLGSLKGRHSVSQFVLGSLRGRHSVQSVWLYFSQGDTLYSWFLGFDIDLHTLYPLHCHS